MPASDVYSWAKASSKPSYSTSEISGLQTALDGKANSSHTHTISQITNLQSTLNGKANASHSHSEYLKLSIQDMGNKEIQPNGSEITIPTLTINAYNIIKINVYPANYDNCVYDIYLPSGGTYLYVGSNAQFAQLSGGNKLSSGSTYANPSNKKTACFSIDKTFLKGESKWTMVM